MAALRGKILVIRGGAIGDFILTVPVLSALRANFPEAGLELLGYPHIASLARLGNLVDDIRPIEARPLAGFFARNGAPDAAWKNYFAGFDIILSYLYDPDAVFESNVRSCSRARFVAGPHRPDDQEGRHATEVFLKPLEQLAIFDCEAIPRLSVERSPAATPLLAVHPGSGSDKKNWPETQWAELLQRLARAGAANLLLVGGEAEEGRLERLAAPLPSPRVQLARCLPLPELARRLAGCHAFVGHDSGITHLAAAVGLPTLALWGPSAEAVWRPRGPRVELLRVPTGLAHLEVDAVWHAVESLGRAS